MEMTLLGIETRVSKDGTKTFMYLHLGEKLDPRHGTGLKVIREYFRGELPKGLEVGKQCRCFYSKNDYDGKAILSTVMAM